MDHSPSIPRKTKLIGRCSRTGTTGSLSASPPSADLFVVDPGEHEPPYGRSDQRFHQTNFAFDCGLWNSLTAHLICEFPQGRADASIGGSGRSFAHQSSGDFL